ncbi:hypothetical protein ONZ45_g829 [Pleurotus djamor]|nr:hypothetical protein ONZ45_g829 [Pleurotus djamor]
MAGRSIRKSLLGLLILALSSRSNADPNLDDCPGYEARNIKTTASTLTVDLILRGGGCHIYGPDIQQLTLKVQYETENRIHLKISDPNEARYEVPESVFPRPASQSVDGSSAAIQFNYTESPFTFSIYRTKTQEVLFSTASHPIIFEPQYLRVKTKLPSNANIYGLGEHSNSFRLDTNQKTLTLWALDAFGIPEGSNIYGTHPIYFEHRTTGTHGVFFLNSNGIDVKLTDGGLEYNAIGGVIDLYFLAGSETDPTEVSKQYAQLVGPPAEMPYWAFGLHQCRFMETDFVRLAEIAGNYSMAEIPLETMWVDIDYMHKQRIFTVDPDYFPLPRMRELVSYLHSHDQRFVLMTNPAVAYAPEGGYGTYERGAELDLWMKAPNGNYSVVVYPDWFHDKVQEFWNNEFELFYNPHTGLDIDGAWIDMNEPANPPNKITPDQGGSNPPSIDTPLFANVTKRGEDRNLLAPPYRINNGVGDLSVKTAPVDSVHSNGLVEYDVHSLFGTMMSTATHNAMLARRPGLRPFVITRSTFAGAGRHVGKWLGDNFSRWDHYRISIAGMLGMASVYQIPMVGSDVCGFYEDTNPNLCARWTTLGAFYPFMRNHNAAIYAHQEFYQWPVVASAARKALDIRYRLLDYFYTAFHQAHLDGTPVLHPVWFKYPKDSATFGLDLQFFFGDSILVSPVTEQDSTSVSVYLPHDTFYDFHTLAPVQGNASSITLSDVSFTDIPLHIKGGVVLPLRTKSAMTTTDVRKQDFEFIVAPGSDGRASGQLYIDDGESIAPASSTIVTMSFEGNRLEVQRSFGYETGVRVARVRFLGIQRGVERVQLGDRVIGGTIFNETVQVLDVPLDILFDKGFSISIL